MEQPLCQSDATEHLRRQRPRLALTPQLERQHDVFKRVQIGQQLKALEHKADLGAAQGSTLIFVECEQVLAAQPDPATAGRIQPGQDRQQGTLARTRRADDGHRFAGTKTEADVVENGQLAAGVLHLFADAFDFYKIC